ncbi:putative mycofactocin radical SAM maturase MftC [Calidithermus terrae]|uniref:Putative mycofactocin radical SAM maturase MftC n=1 Tax=Calidithermus terrae TaxID=1408545 RepID=A0A399F1S1_9DEIN|nr:radical SAM protein [Calidithermus terrae]RIH90704.1 putative mycofactocin radical SAM maturase MftC [Calidithermus terrae]
METVVAERVQQGSDRFRPLVYWYLSNRCNLTCKHCWVSSSPHADTSADLTTEEILATVAQLKEIDASLVILTGGEPLLRKDALTIIGHILEHGLALSVETNAMLIRDEHVRLFRDALDRGVFVWISVSLDGGTREAHEWIRGRGSFDPTVKALYRLRAANIPFGVQCVVNRQNFRSIPDLFRLANNLDFHPQDNILAFPIVNPVGRGSESKDDLALTPVEYEQVFQLILGGMRDYKGGVLIKVPPAAIPSRYLQYLMRDNRVKFLVSCSFPLLGILPDGTLSVCALTGADGGLVLGHLRQDSIAEVVKNSIEPLRKDYENATLTGVCADCVFRHSCKGSCRAYAYSEFGSFIGPHPLCAALEKAGMFPDVYRNSYHQRLRSRAGAA